MAQPMIVSVDSLIVEITGGAGPVGPEGPAGEGGGDGGLTVTLTEDATTYFYFGGLDAGDDWQINRWTKASLGTGPLRATIANNALIANLAAAWTARATLTYA